MERPLHERFLEAIGDERQRVASRRGLLAGGAKLAAGSALGLGLVGTAGFRRFAGAQEFTDDLDILNYALTLELLEANFYRTGLEEFGTDDFDEGVFDNLELIRDHEEEHVDLLTTTVTTLGGTPVEEAEYDFGYEDADGFLEVAAALENTGVQAYDGAAASIQSVDVLAVAGQIVAVEARHASYLNLLNGETPFPAAFEEPLDRAAVLEIAGGFIVSDGAASPEGDESSEEDTASEEDATSEVDTASEEDATSEEDTASEEDASSEEDTASEEDASSEEDTESSEEDTESA